MFPKMSTLETYVIQNISSYNQVPKTCISKISTYLKSTSYNIHENVKLTFKNNNCQPLILSQKAKAPREYQVFNLFVGRERGAVLPEPAESPRSHGSMLQYYDIQLLGFVHRHIIVNGWLTCSR